MSHAFAALFYLATAVLLAGVVARMVRWVQAPSPLKIPTTPAPTTRSGVALRLAREAVFFESLFRANLWLWACGWVFHLGLALALLRHLRYFTEPVWGLVAWMQPLGIVGGALMVAGLAGLWLRRWAVERIRHISTPSDHLMLALLLAIGASGLAMKFLVHTDVVAVKQFFLGLLSGRVLPLPDDPLLYLHLLLVATLMAIFPFSKLLHAPGLFFSPTRHQVDDPREQRHQAAWAARLDVTKG
ncbi:MAG TPA: respiratory nitrate reductase subunit gamma [Burkholderiaceae bacterium]|nr:respiratory nitrate reductase subunit gamma [Burkholderiaceae bacterium]HMX11195.1 respiratory nitrate reductase subunit gamma [Burkholderiaceae bacterium]HNB46442.1 respiratory nitrate reductase subunit gamma [Burkholderiaceae bacterium]HNG78813.1 respiratory nitrate reductase subunit gamma [Burkholderiaceae bacterium]